MAQINDASLWCMKVYNQSDIRGANMNYNKTEHEQLFETPLCEYFTFSIRRNEKF